MSRVFLVISVFCFLLATMELSPWGVDMIAIGLASGFGSFLVKE